MGLRAPPFSRVFCDRRGEVTPKECLASGPEALLHNLKYVGTKQPLFGRPPPDACITSDRALLAIAPASFFNVVDCWRVFRVFYSRFDRWSVLEGPGPSVPADFGGVRAGPGRSFKYIFLVASKRPPRKSHIVKLSDARPGGPSQHVTRNQKYSAYGCLQLDL